MPAELILALDANSPEEVLPILERLRGTVRWVKVGLEMYTAAGPEAVRRVAGLGFNVFLDLKLHDIPNTVAKSVESASRLPIGMLTIHTAGGREMMGRAVEAQRKHAPNLRLLGVTVLTSMGEASLRETGVPDSPAGHVARLAKLAIESGMSGLVCSPLELPVLRPLLPPGVVLVTPGIRPPGPRNDDQTRVMTPAEAGRAGASFIVVGRPIFAAADPATAARDIHAQLATA